MGIDSDATGAWGLVVPPHVVVFETASIDGL